MLKRTALYSAHQKLGAKLIDFGGWEMPVQYTSITGEHLAVRSAAGVFDISHMGEVTISGAGAAEFLNRTLANDIRKLTPGQGQYTLMCNERGGVIDDLYAYRLAADAYFLIINASRIDADVAWLKAQAAKFTGGELNLTDASHHYAAIAVQGPKVRGFINSVIPGASDAVQTVAAVSDLKKNQLAGFQFENHNVLVACTGYTGEDGFEILGPEAAAGAVGQTPFRRLAIWHQALRPRRARHAPHGSVLSALRPRTRRTHHAHRSRGGIFCLARQRRI